MKNEVKHTARWSYRCKYYVVFTSKYRRKIIHRSLHKEIGKIMWKLRDEMRVEIIEAEACPDHIHMLVSIPPYMGASHFVGTSKLEVQIWKRKFWCIGYYIDTVGKNEKLIREYIRNQLEENYTKNQISMKVYIDPFAGNRDK